MKNNSYVCIPAGKFVELISRSCPPLEYDRDNGCFGKGEDCINCWCDWLKDGE